jgi:putative nucleotidyltransferase with HDIG domain
VLLADPPTVTDNSLPRTGSPPVGSRERDPGGRTRDLRSGRLPEPSSDLSTGTLKWVLVGTGLVAVLPAAATWWLRSSGIVSSPVVSMAAGLCISLAISWAAHRFWQTRPGSRDLLFSELMIWGYMRRRLTERRLTSARRLLGAAATSHSSSGDGLSPDRQAKLLERLARSLDTRDHATYGHSRRVARYASMIAKRMELSREQVARIRTAAAIHDVGKIKTPDSILRKPGALTDDEYAVIKLHAAAGSEMAAVLRDPELSQFIRSHHERLDGSGYPDALMGEQIPIGARIIAVADTFDALTANRPYQTARTHREALDLLKREAEGKLDADAVRAFREEYSGRRSLVLWASITSLPERVLGQFTGDVTGAASAAKGVALSAVAAAIATSTAATLAHPPSAAARAVRAVALAPATHSQHQQMAPHGPARSTSAPTVDGRRHERRTPHRTTLRTASSHTTATVNGDQPNGDQSVTITVSRQTQGSSPPAPGNGQPEEQKHVVKQPETQKPTEQPGTPPAEDKHEPSSHEEHKPSQSAPGGVEEIVKGTVEETEGKVEEVKGKVEETKGKLEEVAKGKLEEVKGKVEETKGKLEETAKGTVGEVKGKLEEIAKGKG